MKKIQREAIKLIVDNLDDVERFGDNPHIVVKNTVREHIQGLIALINELDIDEALRADLSMRALLHDAGELGGEISTVTAVLNAEAPTKAQKDDFELSVFRVFCHFAMLCVQDKVEDEFYKNLGLLRNLVKKLDDPPDEKTNQKKITLDGIIEWLKFAYKKQTRHGDAFYLEDLYDQATEQNSYEGRIFKALDLLEGNQWYCDHAIDVGSTTAEELQNFLTYAREIISHLGTTEVEIKVAAMVEESLVNYENLVKSGDVKNGQEEIS